MPTKKLTAVAIEKLKPPTSGRIEYWDAAMPAFGLRITETGNKSWTYMYRYGGKVRRLTIGRYPALSLKRARELAGAATRKVAEGYDPAAERQERRLAAGTFEAVAGQFVELYAKRRQRSWEVTKRYLERDVIPHWGRRPVDSLTRGDVLTLLDRIMAEGKETKANRLHGHLNKLFTWAAERELIERSPMERLTAPARTVSRDRVLDDNELVAIWRACEAMGFPFGPLTKLLVLTAQRRTEVGTMRWADLDLENAIWHLPREVTKSDRAHEVPLSPLAVEILESLPQFGRFIFSSGRRGDKPVSGWGPAKGRLDKLSRVAGWRFHDLRRTAASGMAKLNTPPHVLAKLLNHVSDGTGVTAIYNRHGYEVEKRDALEAWARHLISLIKPAETNVVELASRADAN